MSSLLLIDYPGDAAREIDSIRSSYELIERLTEFHETEDIEIELNAFASEDKRHKELITSEFIDFQHKRSHVVMKEQEVLKSPFFHCILDLEF